MKEMSLSQEIKNLEKKDFSIKEHKKNAVLEEVKKQVSTTAKKLENNVLTKSSEHKSSTNLITKSEPLSNLPEIRKVALAKKRTHIVLLAALFISCFSLSVFIGFIGPFLLFK